MKKKFWIGERINPQLKKPYYNAYGQLTKKDAKKKENTAYGSMYLTPYDLEAEYKAKIEELKHSGFKVNNC